MTIAINKLKSDKAPQLDHIPLEALKNAFTITLLQQPLFNTQFGSKESSHGLERIPPDKTTQGRGSL